MEMHGQPRTKRLPAALSVPPDDGNMREPLDHAGSARGRVAAASSTAKMNARTLQRPRPRRLPIENEVPGRRGFCSFRRILGDQGILVLDRQAARSRPLKRASIHFCCRGCCSDLPAGRSSMIKRLTHVARHRAEQTRQRQLFCPWLTAISTSAYSPKTPQNRADQTHLCAK